MIIRSYRVSCGPYCSLAADPLLRSRLPVFDFELIDTTWKALSGALGLKNRSGLPV
jgi:hypothetical protein